MIDSPTSKPGLVAWVAVLSLAACANAAATPAPPCAPSAPPPAIAGEAADPAVRASSAIPVEIASLRKAALDAWAAGDIELALKIFGSYTQQPQERRRVDDALYDAVVGELAKRQQAVGLELSKVEPVVMDAPPAQAVVKTKGPTRGARPKALVFKAANQSYGHYSERGAPIEMVRQTAATPSAYRGTALRGVIDDDERRRFVFGSSSFADPHLFVAVAATEREPARVFDFTKLLPKPGGNPQDILDAHLVDGVVYAQIARLRVAEAGYIAAWDAATGSLLWRSASSIANGDAFFVGDSFIASAFHDGSYRFAVTLLDRATGAVVARAIAQNGYAQTFRFEGSELVAVANSGTFTFELRR